MKKYKRYLLRGLIAFGLIFAILLGTNSVYVVIRGRRLEQKIAAIRTAGDPVSFSQLAPTEVTPPEQNAAVFLSRAQVGVEKLSKELFAVYSAPGFFEGSPSKNDIKAVESALQGSPDVIPLLRQAAACSEYDPQIDYTVSPEAFIETSLADRLGQLRAVTRLLNARVVMLVAQGDRKEAFETCLWMLRLSRSFEREPAFIGFLVSVACRAVGIRAADEVLRSGPLPKSAHLALDTELALHDSTEAYIRALKSERVLGIESFQSLRSQLGSFQWWFLSDECDYLDLFSEQFEFVSRPYSELVAAGLENKYKGRIGPLSSGILPALLHGRRANDRSIAKVRSLRILNTLQTRADAGDKSEPKLEDLGLPESATTDPFTGMPLRLKKTDTGWLVYSTGENLKDDGGELADLRDIGLGPKKEETGPAY
ncbi:MAG: hypothetical protein JWM11_4891 [Planctomycetaceae bacterium]|nr:hypothetical protein [Planctomycetaceae bacterium]